ncbi:MlaC/ttg2D family ABC transporter substrate-binding protein [Neisseria canis]|uniref:Periplasmic transport protein n=1 Tax=Neisseria canis TaxID=493 RepID=A0A448D5P3_9NEIS|nr:ABC transporter substrate-binding protein [Neisseria canis]OSI13377.1 toluene tolerance protein [Neisseria canis]VEE99360.1 periplasmic transport protein [Neisseria canis]
MNKLFTVMLAAPVMAAAPFVHAAPAEHPAQTQFKQNMDAVLQIARDKSLNENQKIQRITGYADRYLDYQRISALAVGMPWREFSTKQQGDFIQAFKDMVVSIYSRSALMGAADAQVTMLPKMTEEKNKRVTVFTEIKTGNGKKYEVGYRLYPVGSTYKIYDIQVDGSSLVTVYRNQFNELVKQKGIDGTIETVRQKGLKKVE